MKYLTERRQDWEELAALTAKAKSWRGARQLTADDFIRFDYLYRRASADLAQIRARTGETALRHYLNDLVAAAHSVIYVAPKNSFWHNSGEFLATSLPRALAAHWRAHLLSFCLLLAGVITSYWLIERDPTVAYTFDLGKTYGVNTGDVRTPGASVETLTNALLGDRDRNNSQRLFFSMLLFANNLRVALLAMLTGILAGIPTVLLIFYNGMILGAFIHLYHSHGIYGEMWAWLLPHALPEITAVTLGGGIGLLLAKCVLAPGYKTRMENLRIYGRQAIVSALGMAILVLFAALIESFIRDGDFTTRARLIFAIAIFLLMSSYAVRGFWLLRKYKITDL